MRNISTKQYTLFMLRKEKIIDSNNKECYNLYGERLYANGVPMYTGTLSIPCINTNLEYNIAKRKHCNWRKYKTRYKVET